MSAGASSMTPQQINALQRAAVLNAAVSMTQQVYSTTLVGGSSPLASNVLQIVPRNVGLIKRFIIEISGTVKNTDANVAALTQFGLSNLIQSIQFTDLNNNQRVNTSGWHLTMLQAAKYRRPYGSGYALETDNMTGFGENFPVIVAPSPAAGANSTAFRAQFELPLAYNDDDLRGAVFANVVNATMQLQITLNPQPAATTATDNTLAVWGGLVAGANLFYNSITVTVYQEYLDQLPVGKNGTVLPILDLSTIYELKTTPFQAITAGQDFPIPYANFRDFLSTFAVFYNGAARTNGSDINYWALQSANFTNLWKQGPLLCAYKARMILNTDYPLGVYYFSSRRKPISTLQYGNMELVLNAITAGAGSYILVGWEDFALVNTLTNAGSLAGGGA